MVHHDQRGRRDLDTPFAINAGTGVITLADSGDIDYETTTSYNLRSGHRHQTDSETITITITDVGLTVTDTSANLGETAANGATVVDVDNTGDDDIAGLTRSITTNGADADSDGTPLAINADRRDHAGDSGTSTSRSRPTTWSCRCPTAPPRLTPRRSPS